MTYLKKTDLLQNGMPRAVKNFMVFTVMASLLLSGVPSFSPEAKVAQAAALANLVSDGSFEGNIADSWTLWQDAKSERTYEFYRSLVPAFGQGSFSAAVSANGVQGQAFDAGIVTNKNRSFDLVAGKTYRLSYYAKADYNFKLVSYVQNADTFASISDMNETYVSSTWKKYNSLVKPTASAKSLLTFAFGEMPAGTVLSLDTVELTEMNVVVNTKEVKGKIGDRDKFIDLANSSVFSESDIAIELPYFDSTNKYITTLKVNPKKKEDNKTYFDMPEKTFGGIANVYASDVLVGSFDYNVLPQVDSLFPTLVRGNEDLVTFGSGLNPIGGSTFLIVSRKDINGKVFADWIAPTTVDTSLSQASFKMPTGVISGTAYLNTVFYNTNGTNTANKSNGVAYKVKPVITGIEWSQKGYEMVGDKIKITGNGMVNSPKVNFYDNNGKKIDSKTAKVIALDTNSETIETTATDKLNNLKLTVESGGVESDLESAETFQAMSRITSIKTKIYRTNYANQEKIPAANIGEEITINGKGLKTVNGDLSAEFQGYNKTITVSLASSTSNVDPNGSWVKVTVPDGTQTGYVSLTVNGQKSNSLYLEIIPKILQVTPETIYPGHEMTIIANGVGADTNLAKITFNLDGKTQVTVKPRQIDIFDAQAYIYLTAPLAVSNKNTKIGLEYDRWKDTATPAITANPHISSAGFDPDTQMLIIKGYGFSTNMKENVITYKYADEAKTVITPKVTVIGVFTTEEGQEIRIKVLDDYHYGLVTVTVGDQSSNEANFGPLVIRKIARRVEYVSSLNKVMGVLYISGYNFGQGGVLVGSTWADVHYRSNFFIIAVVDPSIVNEPVIIARQ